ncbi:hypothetical protein BGZ63DRAFT_267554 [Mariannaea sp. PMI_226]|nr:hypothetical protein BGZ63DRAFT_267554 [Mariannaea sp. PMI_226]
MISVFGLQITSVSCVSCVCPYLAPLIIAYARIPLWLQSVDGPRCRRSFEAQDNETAAVWEGMLGEKESCWKPACYYLFAAKKKTSSEPRVTEDGTTHTASMFPTSHHPRLDQTLRAMLSGLQ